MLTAIEAYESIESHIRMSGADSLPMLCAALLLCSCNLVRPWNAKVSLGMRNSDSVSNCCMPQPVHFDVMNTQSGSVRKNTNNNNQCTYIRLFISNMNNKTANCGLQTKMQRACATLFYYYDYYCTVIIAGIRI